ncbi:hypothetical protein [Pseudanabaena sp. PCC 6802]|uniref:hypothetical protein n=1 Tax=Pseudanabaena sp. PCC 6802 TaxID=118173 RepID=UPI000346D820|nr:hypothetical protein [Pseudanabaena sp. PCC 6802]
MKRVLATGFAAVAAALALGTSQPAQAQTRCRWVGRQMQCQDTRINNDYYYDRGRNNRYYNDGGYYEEWRRQDRSYHNDQGYYEDWRRDQWRNNDYYSNRSYANNGDLRRAINDIYRRELGRNADWEGIRHYTDQYYRGWSLGQIRNDIANSNEARNRYYYRY